MTIDPTEDFTSILSCFYSSPPDYLASIFDLAFIVLHDPFLVADACSVCSCVPPIHRVTPVYD